MIDAANLADKLTIAAVDGIRFTEAGTTAASQRLSEGVAGDPFWAATWIYASYGTDPAPLLPLLTNDDATIRAFAAAGLTSLGRVEGLDALIELVAVDALVKGSEPPLLISRFAAATLARYTSGAVDASAIGTPEEREATQAAWQTWLEANRDRLVFDQDQGVWVVS